jgi:hypothetical protein
MAMEKPILAAATRLARVGEQAGMSVEEIIQLLESGVSINALLDLIEQQLTVRLTEATTVSQGSY